MRKSTILCVLLLVACGADSATAPPGFVSTVAGTYTLVTVADQPMPFHHSDDLVYLSGRIDLHRDSTFADWRSLRFGDMTIKYVLEGSYSVHGDSVQFVSTQSGGSYMLGRTEGALTVRWPDGLFVYRK
jgi:hypothetical protein